WLCSSGLFRLGAGARAAAGPGGAPVSPPPASIRRPRLPTHNRPRLPTRDLTRLLVLRRSTTVGLKTPSVCRDRSTLLVRAEDAAPDHRRAVGRISAPRFEGSSPGPDDRLEACTAP